VPYQILLIPEKILEMAIFEFIADQAKYLRVRGMVFNATFNDILEIVAVSFIGEGNRSTRRKPPTCYKSPTNFIT
jgi:hypothetical protein